MRWLKVLLAINGVAFVFYAVSNIFLPTSYFLPAGTTGYAVDLVRVVGMAYGALGLIQLGMWLVTDRLTVRIVAIASLLFAAGFAVQAAIQGTGSTDTFHQIGLGVAAGNAVVVALYGYLLYRERTATIG